MGRRCMRFAATNRAKASGLATVVCVAWAKRSSRLKATAARRLFLDHDYGRVSDHEGFMVTFEVA